MEYNSEINGTVVLVVNTTNETKPDPMMMIDFKPYDEASAVISFILFAAIIILNGLVIYNIGFKKQKKNRFFYFVLHLAIADFLVGMFCVLGDGIQSAMYGEWWGGDIVCKLLRFSKVVTIMASNNILIGMSVDRFLAIKYPLNVVRVGACRFVDKGMVFGAWLISLGTASLYIFYSKGVNADPSSSSFFDQKGSCNIHMPKEWLRIYIIIVSLVIYILPTVGISVCYVGICVIVWRKLMTSHKLSEISTHASNDRLQADKSLNKGLLPKAKVKSIKMTLVVCLAFFICWTPYFVTILLSVHNPDLVDPRYFVLLGSLYPLNSACNPLIFILFNIKMFFSRQKEQQTAASYEGISTQVTSA